MARVIELVHMCPVGHRERGLLVLKGDLYQLAADLGAPAATQPAAAPAPIVEAADQQRQAAQTPQTIAAWQRLAADGQALDSSGVPQPGAHLPSTTDLCARKNRIGSEEHKLKTHY